MSDRAQFIEGLVSEAKPVGPYRAPGFLALLWLAISWVSVVAVTLFVAPLRPGAFGQLIASPHFAIESLLGLLAGAVAIRTALVLGFPRAVPVRTEIIGAVALPLMWIALQTAGLWSPALDPSMAGKREFCACETLLYGTPPMLAGLWLLRRCAVFQRIWAGALVGAAAGAVPGLLMQFACMYVPEHILTHHLAPAVGLALAGAVLGPLVLRRV